MPAFRIRAQWWGPDGDQVGVADDTMEAADACSALDNALPREWREGQYTHATITIEPLPQYALRFERDASQHRPWVIENGAGPLMAKKRQDKTIALVRRWKTRAAAQRVADELNAAR